MAIMKGIAASPGIAIGPLWIYSPEEIVVKKLKVSDIEAERKRLSKALEESQIQLGELEEKARGEIGEEEAEIFGAHQMLLSDPTLQDAILARIEKKSWNAERAVQKSVKAIAKEFKALEDEYFQARALDIQDVGRRLLRNLMGISEDLFNFPDEPVIILAEDLTPSDTVQFDKSKLMGLITVKGGATSHTAILARSIGIPAIVSLPVNLDDLDSGKSTILDSLNGEVTFDPSDQEIHQAIERQRNFEETQAKQLADTDKPAITKDGVEVEIVANIGNLADAQMALEYGAMGVGLFRTEFLYLDSPTLPDEEKQTKAYKEIFDVMGTHAIVVRTLDIGGDKEVPYLGFKEEMNPFLGWRAIRMLDAHEDVLLTQYRALLRAGVDSELRIMVPMVSRLTEVELARELLEKAKDSLAKDGIPHNGQPQFGIMIEVPSVVLILDHISPLVDFFSIGTNDLTQYTMAVDRTNERIASIATPFHPSVLKLIAQTIESAHQQNKWVGLCGEFASDPMAVPILLGLGLDEFSMSPTSIPAIKALVRNLSAEDCKEIAQKALKLPKSEAILTYMQSVINESASIE